MLKWIASLLRRPPESRWGRALLQAEYALAHSPTGLAGHVRLALAGMRAAGFPPPRVAEGPSRGVYAEWAGAGGVVVITWYDDGGRVRSSASGSPRATT